MNLPATTATGNTPFTLQAGRDFLTALQAQDPPSATAVDFNQALDTAHSITDLVEVGTVGQAMTLDPTSSSLFQAHLGVLSAGQALAASSDLVSSSEQLSQLKVTGINASSATGLNSNRQPLQPEDFRAELVGPGSAELSRYPAVAGPGDFTSIYDSLRGAGRMNPAIGTGLDLKG